MNNYSEQGKVLDRIVTKVGDMIVSKKGLDSRFSIEGNEIKIELDKLADEMGRKLVFELLPDHEHLTEENLDMPREGELVVIGDFLDGTGIFFKKKLPNWSVLLALANGGVTRTASAYLPEHGQLFNYTEGNGTLLNGQKIEIARVTSLREARICLDPGYDDWAIANLDKIEAEMQSHVGSVVRLSSNGYALSRIVTGEVDGIVHLFSKVWEEAGAAVAKGAGAVITDLNGGNIRLNLTSRNGFEYVAGIASVHQELQLLARDAVRRIKKRGGLLL